MVMENLWYAVCSKEVNATSMSHFSLKIYPKVSLPSMMIEISILSSNKIMHPQTEQNPAKVQKKFISMKEQVSFSGQQEVLI